MRRTSEGAGRRHGPPGTDPPARVRPASGQRAPPRRPEAKSGGCSRGTWGPAARRGARPPRHRGAPRRPRSADAATGPTCGAPARDRAREGVQRIGEAAKVQQRCKGSGDGTRLAGLLLPAAAAGGHAFVDEAVGVLGSLFGKSAGVDGRRGRGKQQHGHEAADKVAPAGARPLAALQTPPRRRLRHLAPPRCGDSQTQPRRTGLPRAPISRRAAAPRAPTGCEPSAASMPLRKGRPEATPQRARRVRAPRGRSKPPSPNPPEDEDGLSHPLPTSAA